MKSKSKDDIKPKKIVKSMLGIFISCLHTFIFFVSVSMAIFLYTKTPISGFRKMNGPEEFACWAIGMVPKVLEGHGRDYGSITFALYLAACLLQMYIPLRALIQPSFLAGKPDINSFWPLVLALILRFAIEIIYIVVLGTSIVIHAIILILINAVYSYIVFEIYSVDDDNLPLASEGKSSATNLKPWQFEVKNELPKYSDSKK